MNNQDEIRDDIGNHIYTLHIRRQGWQEWDKLPSLDRESYIQSLAMPILRKLASQDVVVRGEEHQTYRGYYKVDSLVEGTKKEGGL